MRKAIVLALLAVMSLTMSFAGNPEKPAPKCSTVAKPIVKLIPTAHIGTNTCSTNDALLPVPVVTVYTNVAGAPGSTGTWMCTGTYVVVTQMNECGQNEVIQQYWVSGSINCGYIVNG